MKRVMLLLVGLAVGCGGESFGSGTGAGGAGAAGAAGTGAVAGGPDGQGGAAATGGDDGGASGAAGAAMGGAGGAWADAAAGAGGAGAAGTGGVDAGTAGAGGDDAGGAGASGAAGSSDAGSESCDEPLVLFRDEDGDGYGVGDPITSCEPVPGTAPLDGDCNDEDARAFPGQTAYFDRPHGSGAAASFDFDCDSQETQDPSQFGPAPNCLSVGAGCQHRQGFARTSRNGEGQNPYCGSVSLVRCYLSGLTCAASTTQVSEGLRCR